MVITYSKLWKLLIDKKMKKKDLQAKAKISASTIAKLGRDEHVSTAVLQKICNALDCDIADIMSCDTDVAPSKTPIAED